MTRTVATGHHRAPGHGQPPAPQARSRHRAWADSMGFRWHIQEGTGVPQSAIFVPLISGGRSIGGHLAPEPRPRGGLQRRRRATCSRPLASSLSVALENARLFDETKRLLTETDERAAELAVINEVQGGLADQLDFEAIIQLVGERIRSIFKARTIYIGILDAASGTLSFPFDLFDGASGPHGAIRRRAGAGLDRRPDRPATSLSRAPQSCTRSATSTTALATESWLGVPIGTGDRVLGAIVVESPERGGVTARASSASCRRSPGAWASRSRTPGCSTRPSGC